MRYLIWGHTSWAHDYLMSKRGEAFGIPNTQRANRAFRGAI